MHDQSAVVTGTPFDTLRVWLGEMMEFSYKVLDKNGSSIALILYFTPKTIMFLLENLILLRIVPLDFILRYERTPY